MAIIRKEIREYILKEVNLTLSRLGINEHLTEINVRTNNNGDEYYVVETAPIHHMPVMFKELRIIGTLEPFEPNENNRFYALSKTRDFAIVDLHYSYSHFDGGSNGCKIGTIVFSIKKDLPDSFVDDIEGDTTDYYVKKLQALEI